jgi:hypothetical protein
MDSGISGNVAIFTRSPFRLGNGRAIVLALALEGCDMVCLDIDLPKA